MTFNQRRQYSRQYQSLVKMYETKYISPVYNALNEIRTQAVKLIRENVHTARAALSVHVFNQHIHPVIEKLYKDAGLTRARQVRSELRGEQKRFGYNDELVQSIFDYLSQFLLEKTVLPISRTTRDWILGILESGIADGLGAYEIADKIENDQFLKYQALRIVRTETVRATNVGAMQAAATSPFVVVKEWISAHDNRVRHSHMLVDGTVAEMGEAFSNGLMQPGDPNGEPEATINCRCTVAITAKRDEDGRLIMNNQYAAA